MSACFLPHTAASRHSEEGPFSTQGQHLLINSRIVLKRNTHIALKYLTVKIMCFIDKYKYVC